MDKSNDYMLISNEEDKEISERNPNQNSLKSSKMFELPSENKQNDNFIEKSTQTDIEIINHGEESTQTDFPINNNQQVLDDYNPINKTMTVLLFLSIIICILYTLPHQFGEKPEQISKDLPIVLNEAESSTEQETVSLSCGSETNSTTFEVLTDSIKSEENCLKTDRYQPEEIKYLLPEECNTFKNLASIIEKLDYLEKKIDWTPLFEGTPLKLIDIFPYKVCEYFIGYTDSSLYKFTLYKDFTKSLNFAYIDNIVISPDNEFIGLSENFKGFSIITLRNFQSVSLDTNLKLFGSRSLVDFSPDSSYLYYTRENYEKISVFSTSSHKNIQNFEIKNQKPIQMKASENKYHLIVKDESQSLKVFSIHSSDYIYLCSNSETIKLLEKDFPELKVMTKNIELIV